MAGRSVAVAIGMKRSKCALIFGATSRADG